MDKRSKNFTGNEKEHFSNIVLDYKHVIENKNTDGTTMNKKNECWAIITAAYNSINESGVRTEKQLKELYAFLKRKARKNLYNDKAEQIKTGGGTYIPQSDEIDAKIVSQLKPQYVPEKNPYDSSATLFFEDIVEVDIVMDDEEADDNTPGKQPLIIIPATGCNIPPTSSAITPVTKSHTSPTPSDTVPVISHTPSTAYHQRSRHTYLKDVASSIVNRKTKKTRNEEELVVKKHTLIDKEKEIKEEELQLIKKKKTLIDLEIKIKTVEYKMKEHEYNKICNEPNV